MSVSNFDEMLSKALFDLKNEFGSNEAWAWEMITEESGVYNVKKIAEGVIKPTKESWQQLYKAFPDKIPPPKMSDGEVVDDKSVCYLSNQVIF